MLTIYSVGYLKTFKTFRTSKTVVKNVSINFFENQITGLLGHNGAGKVRNVYFYYNEDFLFYYYEN